MDHTDLQRAAAILTHYRAARAAQRDEFETTGALTVSTGREHTGNIDQLVVEAAADGTTRGLVHALLWIVWSVAPEIDGRGDRIDVELWSAVRAAADDPEEDDLP